MLKRFKAFSENSRAMFRPKKKPNTKKRKKKLFPWSNIPRKDMRSLDPFV